jgi:hypothetical protein
VPKSDLEVALEHAYHQDLEKLVADLLRKQGYEVDPTGTRGADGGVDALLEDGGHVGALHVSRTRSDRLRDKITTDAKKLDEHSRSYDFVIFVTSANPAGVLRQRLENEIEVAFGWPTEVIAREQLRNLLSTDHPDLARQHLNVDPTAGGEATVDQTEALRNVRLDRIADRRDLPNELPPGPTLVVHLIPASVIRSGPIATPGELPTPPFFGHGRRVPGGGKTLGDGVVAYNNRFRQAHPDYAYINEAGWIEAVSTEFFRPNPTGPGGFIDGDIDKAVGGTVKGALYCLEEMMLDGPLFASLALLDVEDHIIDDKNIVGLQPGQFGSRFVPPLVELDDPDPEEFELVRLRPILDRLWYQAGRSNGSPYLPDPEDISTSE